MRPDPEPVNSFRHVVAERAVVIAHAHGPQFSDALEVKRGMAGWPSAARSSCPQARGRLAGARRTAPKRPEKQDASNLLRPAGFIVRQSAIHEPIEFSGLRIGLDLTIPRARVEFDEPASKLRQFLGRQAFNLLFELFDFSHRLVPDLRKMVFYPVLPTHERKERWLKPIGSSATTRSRT